MTEPVAFNDEPKEVTLQETHQTVQQLEIAVGYLLHSLGELKKEIELLQEKFV